MTRSRGAVLIGTAALLLAAALLALFGRSNDPVAVDALPVDALVEDESAEAGPEGPALYEFLKESSGRTVTTKMIRRAMAQAAAMPVSAGTWVDLGPTDIGGRITDLVVDAAHPDTIFVAAAGGGIWKSTDRGSTFTPSWPNDNVQAIGALARGSDGTMWAGTGEANPPGGGLTYFGDGIYSSSDNGAIWQFRGLAGSGSFGRIVVDPTNPSRIYAAASGTVSTSTPERGIYRSVDGGATWQQILAPPNATTGGVDIAIHPSNPNRIYASLWDHRRNNGARFYGGVGSGLYRSEDGGDSWTRLENIVGAKSTYDATGTGLASDATLGRIGIAVAPSDPSRVYVIFGNHTGDDKGFYVSNDGGDSFVAGGRAGGNSRFEWWFGRLWVDPLDKDRLFSADVNLRLSTNGGATWGTSGNVHADQHGMAWDPNVPNRVYLGNDGGIYRSDTNGAPGSWIAADYQPWIQGYHLDVAADDPYRIVIGLQDNGSNRTWANGSSTPAPPLAFNSYGGGDGHYVAIDQTNHNVYYACSQGGNCARRTDTATTSTNAGITTGRHSVRYTTDAPLVIDPNDPLVVYIGGQILDRSLARGTAPWTQLSPSSPDLPGPIPPEQQDVGLYANLYGAITAIGLARDPLAGSVPPNDYAQTIYVGTDTGKLWKTSNAGASWTQMAGVPERWVNGIAVDPTDREHVYAVFSGYREGDGAANIWETRNGGATWTNISGNLPNAPLDSVVIDKADNAVIVSGDLGVFFLRQPPSLPASTTWSKLGMNLPNTSVQDLKIHKATSTLYAMTFGRGIQRIELPGDTAAPMTTAQLSPPPLNGWYVNPMVTLDANDGEGSGVFRIEYELDGGAWQTYTAPFKVTGDGSHTLRFRSTDAAGNVEEPGTVTFQIDATKPAIVITVPRDGSQVPLGSTTLADYDCRDAGSGRATCDGPVIDGAPIDTTPVGTHTFTVNASDAAGNTATATSTYDVIWAGWTGFLRPIDGSAVNRANAGSAVPVRFGLGGDFGLGVIADGYPRSQQVNCSTGAAIGTSTPTTGDGALVLEDGVYKYTWKTNAAWEGTCRRFLLKLDDNTVRTATFRFT